MIPLQNIDLLSLSLGLKYGKDSKGSSTVFDPVRKKYVRTSPEEIVRQLWIIYFLDVCTLNPKLIAVERSFKISGAERRFDLVVFGKSTIPLLLAEFKAPGIKLNQTVFDQIGHYNMHLQVPYALVSNGSEHYCFQIDDERKGFVYLKSLPFLPLNPPATFTRRDLR